MRLEQLPERYQIQAMQQLARTSRIGRIQEQGKPVEEPEKPAVGGRKRETLTPDRADSIVKKVKVSEDGNTVEFTLAVNPHSCSTAQQKGAFVGKDGRVHFFTKSHIAKAEKTFILAMSPYAELTRKWGHVPYEVEFDYYFSYPSGTAKCKLHRIGPMNERPDASNITKGICDALTKAGLWEDDSLINTEISKKRRTTGEPRIVIRVRNLQPAFDELYENEKCELEIGGLK